MEQTLADSIAKQFIAFLETGSAAPGLFTDDIFCDFTLPRWRLQAQGFSDVIGLRLHGHPGPGFVPRWRCDPTPSGFVLELEERWSQNGKDGIAASYSEPTCAATRSRNCPYIAPAIGIAPEKKSTLVPCDCCAPSEW